jgi:hypothetical protein
MYNYYHKKVKTEALTKNLVLVTYVQADHSGRAV